MPALGSMLAFAVFAWWFATGLILFLNHLPSRSFRASLTGATVVLLLALLAAWRTAPHATVPAAYAGFAAALAAWGWQEMTFFMGALTGPRTSAHAAPRGWRRFAQAAQTVLYHELAIAAVGLALFALSWRQPNQVAAHTYAALWAMRLSAKFNIYLGVRNLNEQFVPARLAYLKAYMRRRVFNPLLPFSLLAGLAAAAAVAWPALRAGQGFPAVGAGFVATILALGVIEHAFLVLPLPFAALWTGFSRRCPVAHAAPPPAAIDTGPLAATFPQPLLLGPAARR